MTRPPASRGACPHCHHPIIWGRLQNSRYRTFEPAPVPPDTPIAPADAYAYSHGLRAFVDMTSVRQVPREVLAAHFCAEYHDAKLLAGLAALGDVAETLLTDRHPT